MQIARLLQSIEKDGCDQSLSQSPRSRLSRSVRKSVKAESLEEGGRVTNILDFLDAVSQQVSKPKHDTCYQSAAHDAWRLSLS
jgi:hypothetical protein